MSEILIWSATVCAVIFGRIAEVRVHKQNYPLMKAAGAEELQPKFMKQYYLFSFLVLPFAIIENIVFSPEIFKEMWLGGILLLILGQLLRLWAIMTLGTYWSMACLSLKSIVEVKGGPYRYLKNPEYLSRFLDLTGLCLIFGAKLTFIISTFFLIGLTLHIISVEQRQLREIQGH